MTEKELLEISKYLIKYIDNGDPAKDVIEKTIYTESEVLYQMAKFVVGKCK